VRSASRIALIGRAERHAERRALIADDGSVSYRQLLDASAEVASVLLGGVQDLAESRVAFLTPPGFAYVKAQWGIWRAGGVAVPLCVSHPLPELQYVIEDAEVEVVLAHPTHDAVLRPLARAAGLRYLSTDELSGTKVPLPDVSASRRAMIVYTSGTTSRPKGVVSTHSNIEAQIETLITAWDWRSTDHILHVLPLHHVHGIINVLCCALWSGAVCEVLPRFDAEAVWRRFVDSDLTLFMAVPTIYSKLIAAWEKASATEREAWSRACAKMRLMVSGSAALPVSVLEKWEAISGQVLLERYGMTEIGMALSNPLHGKRQGGRVGTPLPGVEVRLIGEDGTEGAAGEIQVRGPSVFLEYWRRPDATGDAFDDGWFRTGDVAERADNGDYRILGRNSVDIIKTGGFKVSALEVEEGLRTHADIAECAVVGIPDEEWGERVAAALVLETGSNPSHQALRAWATARMAAYKVPTLWLELESLPCNALGKVVKPEVKKLFKADIP
jgi:malonyl-CoA/methylmalonyl-CoA synthetase